MNNKLAFLTRLLILLSGLCLIVSEALADDPVVPEDKNSRTEIRYKGTLISLPCTIDPANAHQVVDMGDITTAMLYRYGHSTKKLVEFKLTGCKTTLGNFIVVSLFGNSHTDGLLAFSDENEPLGAGIALENLDGSRLKLGSDPIKIPLIEGDMVVRMYASVQGETAALANKTLKSGDFSSILTYTFIYE